MKMIFQSRIFFWAAAIAVTGWYGGVALAQGRYLEEVSALEGIYEQKARNVLNTVMTPDQYNLVVSGTLREDEEVLEEYRKEADAGFLPGLIVADDLPTFSPANNKLHQLKTRIRIIVLLDSGVSESKDKVIKELLISKLHLNLEGSDGETDTVVVERSNLPSSRAPASVAQMLPEFTWKMWVLAILLAALAILGVYLWVTRKRVEPEGMQMPDRAPVKDSESGDPPDPSQVERVKWFKQQIISLSSQYPQLVSKAVAEYYDSGHEVEVTVLCDRLGWDVSKKLFTGLSPATWNKLGGMIKDQKEKVDHARELKVIEDSYHFILGRILERGFNKDDNNPFNFLYKLDPSDRKFLLKDEAPGNLAVIGLYSSASQLVDLMGGLSHELQNRVVLEISRLQTLPDSIVQASARSLSEKLEAFRNSPQLEANGPSIAADFLRAMPAEREMDLFAQISKTNPQEADKIRRSRVQFIDLGVYPTDLVSEGIDEIDSSVLTAALFGADMGLVERLLGLMPPKKAMMVQNDLGNPTTTFGKTQIAAARRALSEGVEKAIANRQTTLAEVWRSIQHGSNTREIPRSA